MIVTNGSRLNEGFFNSVKEHLDWVAISIDSVSEATNQKIGRSQGIKVLPDFNWYMQKGKLIKESGVRLKINTVVNSHNYHERELGDLIKALQPERWELSQVLPVDGQNDKYFEEFKITEEQLEVFKQNNKVNRLNIPVVVERNDEMRGSYLMIDPAGRFYDSTKGAHTYSEPLLNVGIEKALKQITSSYEKFIQREGFYNWK